VSVYERLSNGSHVELLHEGESVSTTLVGPISDTLSVTGAIDLEAGSVYRIGYGQFVSIIDAPVNSAATATGNILIEVTAVPEPVLALGLIPCMMLLLRHRPR
jgi:hypothetical protein